MSNLLSLYLSQRMRSDKPSYSASTRNKGEKRGIEEASVVAPEASQYRVESLTRARYLETFKVLQSVSNEYQEMTEFIAKEIKSRFVGRISLLDVGAGSGYLMKKISETYNLSNIYRYVGVEPDATAAASLIKFWHKYPEVRSLVEVERFDQARVCDLQQKFDVVLFSHSLYGIKDPKGALAAAYQLLNPGGIIIAIINTPMGVIKLFSTINSSLDRNNDAIENFDFDSQKLTTILGQLKFQFTASLITTNFDLTSLYDASPKSEERRLEFLSFATQCEIVKAPLAIRENAEFLMRASCVKVGTQILMPQPIAGFVIN